MISKFASHAEFGDELFTEMDKYMKEEGLVATASQSSERTEKSALAALVETLVKCADKLDSVDHPASAKVDKALGFISSAFLKGAAFKDPDLEDEFQQWVDPSRIVFLKEKGANPDDVMNKSYPFMDKLSQHPADKSKYAPLEFGKFKVSVQPDVGGFGSRPALPTGKAHEYDLFEVALFEDEKWMDHDRMAELGMPLADRYRFDQVARLPAEDVQQIVDFFSSHQES